jgi:hypothetical protein
MPTPLLTRRALLGTLVLPLPFLHGCSTPLPLVSDTPNDPVAAQRLEESARVHGLAAFRKLRDINISYDGQWRPLINRIQPEVVDAGFRGPSEERLLPAAGILAQAYTGPRGRKQVHWRSPRGSGGTGTVGVWFNGVASTEPVALGAAALVAECYHLFLLGPLWLADRGLAVHGGGTERVDGRLCDVVNVTLVPGLGFSAQDQVALCIDRSDAITRRMRFTLEGSARTRGAVAETDTYDHARRHGVLWPMRSFERVVHPIALPAHDWRITGLDVDRGYGPAALEGAAFSGAAAAPAARI